MRSDHLSKHLRTHNKHRKEQVKLEDMKIVLSDNNFSGTTQGQQQSQSEQQNGIKVKSSDESQGQDNNKEILYVLKQEESESSNIVLEANSCVNSDQFIWVANEQSGEQIQVDGQTIYTIKQINYAQENSTQSSSDSNDSSEKMTIDNEDQGNSN
jgi:DNA-directed RNA polymerase subunit M/transcription elongation factor TFIIS